ncbi:MAG: PaaI family thioesterase [Chitinophagaceae bacterium]|nr:PaaI family thioesterase [Anaerolineae bacterium]
MTEKIPTQERSHTLYWQDPMLGAQMAKTMSGMDYLQAMARGEIPAAPIAVLMNMQPIEVEPGRVVFSANPAEYHYNPIGTVHGGFAATVLDSALGCAVHSTLPAGTGYSTAELHVNYIRPITAKTGELRCEGKVIHAGKRVATAEARLTDASGKLYAHATTTCLIVASEGE